jgi:hypothetical protein
MAASPLSECLALVFKSKSITASDLEIVEDNARRPSEELVHIVVAAHEQHDENCLRSQFGSDQGSSRQDSTGSRNRKMAGSLTPPTRRKSSLEAPSRPKLTPLKDNRKNTRRSNCSESLPEWLRRVPIEAQSPPIVQAKRDESRNVNETLMLSNAARSTLLVRNAVVSKSA